MNASAPDPASPTRLLLVRTADSKHAACLVDRCLVPVKEKSTRDAEQRSGQNDPVPGDERRAEFSGSSCGFGRRASRRIHVDYDHALCIRERAQSAGKISVMCVGFNVRLWCAPADAK